MRSSDPRHTLPRRRRAAGAAIVAALAVGVAGCGSASHASTTGTRAADTTSAATRSTSSSQSSTTSQPVDGVDRATSSTGLDGGHFTDPYPIDVSEVDGEPLTAFSGTIDELMVCRGTTVSPGCFDPSRLTVTMTPALSAELRAHGLTVAIEANHNIDRLPDGRWEMVMSVEVKRGSATWKLDINAQPQGAAQTDGIPSRWVAGSILVGSLTTPADANYDAKYLDADGQLYLIYSRHLSNPPKGSDGIVAQKLISPTQPASSPPVTILAPTETGSGLDSESADAALPNDTLKLIETGNIFRIGSTWVMIYSDGGVNHEGYKVGVAYADSPIPTGGYRKVLIANPQHAFGTDGDEVDYLLQSEVSNWPHDVRSAVQAPGVGSLVHRDGSWYLFFAADSPSQPTLPNGNLNPMLRYPYYVKLHVDIPAGADAVAHATGEQMSHWITPELGNRTR